MLPFRLIGVAMTASLATKPDPSPTVGKYATWTEIRFVTHRTRPRLVPKEKKNGFIVNLARRRLIVNLAWWPIAPTPVVTAQITFVYTRAMHSETCRVC